MFLIICFSYRFILLRVTVIYSSIRNTNVIFVFQLFQAYFSLNTSILGTFLHIERPYWTGNGTAPQSKSFLEPEKISESEQ